LDSELGRKAYVYDRERQLLAVQAEQPEQSEQFAYDPAGNRTQCNGEAAEFDAANRLLRQGGTRFLYDAHGDLVQWQGGGQAWRYTWNSREQLVRAQSSDGRVVSFGYDAFGRRLWKRSGNRTNPNQTETRFHWAGEHLIGEETWASGERVATQEYLYLPGTHTPLATRTNGSVYYYHCDPLGTPQRLTDGNGRVVWLAESKAFGSTDIKLGEIPNPLRLPGQYYDAETGLHYNRFRYYSPEWGRYVSKDPLAQAGGLNLYAYVGNNPLNQADPMGLWWKAAVSIIAAVAVGIAVTALVVMLAPAALPLAIIAGGMAAGAVGAGLNEALNQESFCWPCIVEKMQQGTLVGFVAALPFAFLPLTAGYALLMGEGGISGGLGYATDILVSGDEWSWQKFGTAVGVGVVTAGVGRYLGPKIAKLWQREQPPNPNKTSYGELSTKEPCFLAGTMIKTSKGNIPIEIIRIGDKVLAYNFQEERTEEKEVKKLYSNWTNVYYDILIKGKSIYATSKHLFWSVDYSKWIPAKDIKVNLQLKTFSGNSIFINSISKQNNVNLQTYNFEVEDINNYFVGEDGVLVHNQNKPSLFEVTTKTNTEIYEVTNLKTGKVEYVGQTTQGTATRFEQHIAEGQVKNNFKSEWGDPVKYRVQTVRSGNWTPYEAHAWEQHYIEKNGGKTSLQNAKNPISQKKYDLYSELHKPC